ncbi:hypothetical protein CYMTET_5373 [Cymbomonas tetramitiformis]|uniref:Uncharacterized protein n=1 Tax=Cymbomonas tetramitiformis TaxID=36881 RepID=A0AAE0GZH8_9CHLO|nr:hypothetical protein CYMTET_5373 [Cymbomonas tetramitiformis]
MFGSSFAPALALLVTVFWAGVRDTFDFDEIFECPSPLHSLSFSPLLTITIFSATTPNRAAGYHLPFGFSEYGPTVRTPTVPNPAPSSNEDADVATRKYLQEQSKLVDDVYKTRLHRQWAKGIREDVLGDKKHHFRGTDDAGLLSELVVQLRTEFHSAGLELASFDLDDPLACVVTKVNGLLFDVLALVIEKHSNAYVWLTGTDASSDRDGRRALVDIIKGCVPVALPSGAG